MPPKRKYRDITKGWNPCGGVYVPWDMLTEIFHYFSPPERIRMALVCKQFKKRAFSNSKNYFAIHSDYFIACFVRYFLGYAPLEVLPSIFYILEFVRIPPAMERVLIATRADYSGFAILDRILEIARRTPQDLALYGASSQGTIIQRALNAMLKERDYDPEDPATQMRPRPVRSVTPRLPRTLN